MNGEGVVLGAMTAVLPVRAGCKEAYTVRLQVGGFCSPGRGVLLRKCRCGVPGVSAPRCALFR